MIDAIGEVNRLMVELLVAVGLFPKVKLGDAVIGGQREVARGVEQAGQRECPAAAGDDGLAGRVAEQGGVQQGLRAAGVGQDGSRPGR